MPVYVVYHQPDHVPAIPEGMAPDVVLSLADCASRYPLRFAGRGKTLETSGYVDLVWLTALEDPVFAAYDYFWVVEYDVDFSGDWSRFFERAGKYEGDLLAARIHRLSDNPSFWFAGTFRQPGAAIADPLIAFYPISRISRRGLAAYREAIASPGWGGHYEILMATIIEHAGLLVADLGGDGPFTPPERRGRHYRGRLDSSRNDGSTHGFRPARGFQYYVDGSHRFREPDRIYHPIKAGLSRRARLAASLHRLSCWWVRTRDTLSGRQRPEDRFTS